MNELNVFSSFQQFLTDEKDEEIASLREEVENLKASLKHVTELVTDVEEMLGLKMLKLEERLAQMEKRNEEQEMERALTGNLGFLF